MEQKASPQYERTHKAIASYDRHNGEQVRALLKIKDLLQCVRLISLYDFTQFYSFPDCL